MRPILVCAPFDNGIRSMLHLRRGIVGAAEGSEYVVSKLQGNFDKTCLPLNAYNLKVSKSDILKVEFKKKQKQATIQAHDYITKFITLQLVNRRKVFCVGGDHSITYPIVKGISKASRDIKKGELGLIYLDAHFDMRQLEGEAQVISSGNAFYRIIKDNAIPLEGNNIMAIAIQDKNSSAYSKAKKFALMNKVQIVYQDDIGTVMPRLNAFLKMHKAIYLSIDLDAFNKSFAPAVSARNSKGLTKASGLKIIGCIANTGKVISADIVEASSRTIHWRELLEEQKQSMHSKSEAGLEKTSALVQHIIDVLQGNFSEKNI